MEEENVETETFSFNSSGKIQYLQTEYKESASDVKFKSYDILSPYLISLDSSFGWTNATLCIGILAFYKSIENDPSFSNQKNNIYKTLNRHLNKYINQLNKIDLADPDNHAFGQIVAELGNTDNTMYYDLFIDKFNAEFMKEYNTKNPWNWIDVLFMSAPLFVYIYQHTGDQKYLEFLNSNWRKLYLKLYDPTRNLFIRDARFSNTNTFWLRGNGWVLAGLVRILDNYPVYDENYEFYKDVFQKMCNSIILLQLPGGLWSTDLNNYSYLSQESSGSALICYSLAYGIDHQILDSTTFITSTILAWNGLKSCIRNNRIIYCQPPSDRPEYFDTLNHTNFGTGTYLMATSAILNLMKK